MTDRYKEFKGQFLRNFRARSRAKLVSELRLIEAYHAQPDEVKAKESSTQYVQRINREEEESLKIGLLQLENHQIVHVTPWEIYQTDQGLYFISADTKAYIRKSGTTNLELIRIGDKLIFVNAKLPSERFVPREIDPSNSGFVQIFLNEYDNPGAASIPNWSAMQGREL